MSEQSIEKRSFQEHPLTGRGKLAYEWIPKETETLLDAGCSYGYATRYYAQKANNTVGIDINEEHIKVAKEKFPDIEFKKSALENIPFDDNTFDTVICTDVLEHTNDKVKSISELLRVLKKDGVLILTVPHSGTFEFMDPYNYGYFLKKYLKPIYYLIFYLVRLIKEGKIPKNQNPEHAVKHYHYSIEDLNSFIDKAGYKEKSKLEDIFRSGLYKEVLAINFERILAVFFNEEKRLKILKPLIVKGEQDYEIDYGKKAYNIAIKVRKL